MHVVRKATICLSFLSPSLPLSTDIIDLLCLCSVSSLCTASLTEGLKLIHKILEMSNKDTSNDHLKTLCNQVREREREREREGGREGERKK